jgi:hypothetical protein
MLLLVAPPPLTAVGVQWHTPHVAAAAAAAVGAQQYTPHVAYHTVEVSAAAAAAVVVVQLRTPPVASHTAAAAVAAAAAAVAHAALAAERIGVLGCCSEFCTRSAGCCYCCHWCRGVCHLLLYVWLLLLKLLSLDAVG